LAGEIQSRIVNAIEGFAETGIGDRTQADDNGNFQQTKVYGNPPKSES
jgi:hypothetical protein